MTATVRIVPQGEIARGTAEPPALRLADRRSFFTHRAARLRSLAAQGSAASSYLDLMAFLADAQAAALLAHPERAAPSPEKLERSRTHGLPPFPGEERTAEWRQCLVLIADRLAPRLPGSTASMVRALSSASANFLENLADRVLEFDYPSVDTRLVPFVGAALQVHLLHRATSRGAAAFRKLDVPNVCPVCGSPAVASALRIDVPVPGSRYLHCTLCGTDWHMPRGQCTHCSSRDKLAYFHVDGGSEAVKAEACDECRSYLKIVNLEKEPLGDPVADDLASLALDVLMDQSGYERAGPNLLFAPGQT